MRRSGPPPIYKAGTGSPVSPVSAWFHTAGEASAAHCRLGVLEKEMSTACIGHRAVRGPVDYRRVLQTDAENLRWHRRVKRSCSARANVRELWQHDSLLLLVCRCRWKSGWIVCWTTWRRRCGLKWRRRSFHTRKSRVRSGSSSRPPKSRSAPSRSGGPLKPTSLSYDSKKASKIPSRTSTKNRRVRFTAVINLMWSWRVYI